MSGCRFRIEGYTDTVGRAACNKRLWARRTEAIVDDLMRGFGVQPARLEAVGEAALEVPTPPQTPEPRNRRVQVVNLGA